MGTPGTPAKTAPVVEKPKDRIGLKLYNTIVIFDDYVVAKSGEEARAALIAGIADGSVQPMEAVAKEVTMKNSIRTSMVEGKPLIASDVTDAEFDTLKGITNSAAFEKFYMRRS